jgi:hypothetical protein
MFAVVDRSSITTLTAVAGSPAAVWQPGMTLPPGPTSPAGWAGPPPQIWPLLSAVQAGPLINAFNPGTVTVQVPNTSAMFEIYGNQSINQGDWLMVEPGPYQEVVQVQGAWGSQFTATFANPHPTQSAVYKVSSPAGWSNSPCGLPGHPGPQPHFDVRSPRYGLAPNGVPGTGVVLHYSIVE